GRSSAAAPSARCRCARSTSWSGCWRADAPAPAASSSVGIGFVAPMCQTGGDSDLHAFSRAAVRALIGSVGACIARGTDISRAEPCPGEHEIDPVGASLTAGQSDDDRTDLLRTGGTEERGRATIRFHTDDVEVLLRMGQQTGSMRWNGPAAVVFRVDERTELRGRFHHRVEIESNLT